MAIKSIVLILIFQVLKIDSSCEDEIAVCKVKENLNKEMPPISTTSGCTYKGFVAESKFFVDKTLLIEKLLADKDGIRLLTYPRLFGKTLNMKMLETFLELQVDKNGVEISPINKTENYNFFVNGMIPSTTTVEESYLHLEAPFLIANRTKIVDNFLGRYPTIAMNLLPLEKPEMSKFTRKMKEVIEDAFRPHSYMMNVFRKWINDSTLSSVKRSRAQSNLEKFDKFWRGDANLTEMQTSINFLSQVLHDYFNKPVYIFLDEYDFPFNTYYLVDYNTSSTNRDIPVILDYLKTFMRSSFQENKYLKSAMIVGVIPIMKHEIGMRTGLHRVVDVNMFSNPINQFYGFTVEEVKLLMDANPEISERHRNEALSYYDGYKVLTGGGQGVKVYNTWSIVQFVNKGRVRDYWTETCALDSYLKSFFRNNNFKIRSRYIVEKNSLLVNLDHMFFNLDDFKMLSRVLEKPRKRKISDLHFGEPIEVGPEDQLGELMFSLLYTTGYLTISNSTTSAAPCFLMKIPNKEIYQIFEAAVKENIEQDVEIP